MIRRFQPRQVIEVGCGNSTRVTRQAIIDGGLETKITAIDPYPRADIAHVVDAFEQKRLEEVDPALFDQPWKPGDVLFIDSSHVVRMSPTTSRTCSAASFPPETGRCDPRARCFFTLRIPQAVLL